MSEKGEWFVKKLLVSWFIMLALLLVYRAYAGTVELDQAKTDFFNQVDQLPVPQLPLEDANGDPDPQKIQTALDYCNGVQVQVYQLESVTTAEHNQIQLDMQAIGNEVQENWDQETQDRWFLEDEPLVMSLLSVSQQGGDEVQFHVDNMDDLSGYAAFELLYGDPVEAQGAAEEAYGIGAGLAANAPPDFLHPAMQSWVRDLEQAYGIVEYWQARLGL